MIYGFGAKTIVLDSSWAPWITWTCNFIIRFCLISRERERERERAGERERKRESEREREVTKCAREREIEKDRGDRVIYIYIYICGERETGLSKYLIVRCNMRSTRWRRMVGYILFIYIYIYVNS